MSTHQCVARSVGRRVTNRQLSYIFYIDTGEERADPCHKKFMGWLYQHVSLRGGFSDMDNKIHHLRDIDLWFIDEVLPHEYRFLRQARRYLSNSELAADIVQDAYAVLFTNEAWRQISNPPAYVLRVVRNLAVEYLRRQSIVRFFSFSELGDPEHTDDVPGPFEHVSGRQHLRLLAAAIAALPSHCRDIVILRRIEELTPREIAKQLGLSLSTVEKRLARGLYLIEKALESDQPSTQAVAGSARVLNRNSTRFL